MTDSGPHDSSLPGSVPEEGKEELRPKTQERPSPPLTGAAESLSDGKPRLRKVKPPTDEVKVWPELTGNAISQLQDHELPFDDLVSLRYKSRRNYRPLCFLPSVFLAFIFDTAVLSYETKAVLSDGQKACMWGKPVPDLVTGRKYCPVIAGLSWWWWGVAWYVLFVITGLITWYRGKRMHERTLERKHAKVEKDQQSYMCFFLDCERAGYTDKHLIAWFVLMTLCFVNSLSIRFVATPDGDEMLHGNACLRYGDWTGHWDHCQPGGLLEPAWNVVLLCTFLILVAAVMDQGTIEWSEPSDWCPLRKVDRITEAAVRLKALVRHQMYDVRLEQMKGTSSLAKCMYGPLNCLSFILGVDGDEAEGFAIRLIEGFQAELRMIFEFKTKTPEASKDEGFKPPCGPCGPDITLHAQAHLRNRMVGNQSDKEWKDEQRRFQEAEDWQNEWMKESVDIDIEVIYHWCPVVESYINHGISRSMTGIIRIMEEEEEEKEKEKEGKEKNVKKSCARCCKGLFRGHQVLGFLLGLLGAYIYCFIAPQGDSFAWNYYLLSQEGLVQELCQATNSTDDPSPWCSTFEYLGLTRTVLWTSHRTVLHITRNAPGVCVCAVTKFIICGILCAFLLTTVFKTVRGLEQAAHPMVFLDAILLWWSKSGQISTVHLHVWKLARDSLLHNDVKNILDRYEKVVLAYFGVSLFLVTDSAIKVAIFNDVPYIMAGYVFVLLFISTLLCGHQALRVHYVQCQHVHTLGRLHEATYLRGASPDAEHQRKLIEVMMSRLSKNGGDYQTRLLYIPLNPTFQKAVITWFFTAILAVIIRLVGETIVADRHPRALDSLNQTSTTVAPYVVRILP